MLYPNIVYIDTLFIINLYVNFFLIKACGAFLHRRISTVRCVLGAVSGGVSSLVILLPSLPLFLNAAIKLVIGAVLVLIVFGWEDFGKFAKNALIFFVINVIFAGVMLVLGLFVSPLGMIYNNGTVYFDISFLALLIFTAAAYFTVRVLRYFLDVRFNADKVYKILFKYNGESRTLSAFADSGNTLTDFFTGKPVIICDKSTCADLFPGFEAADFELVRGLRLLPFSTINGSGIIPVFKPESITIDGKDVDVLLGISKESINKNGVNAIFNPKLLF
jgi:stage II sporulation protein GA (sporulation sigma-E factor processing peptidase)